MLASLPEAGPATAATHFVSLADGTCSTRECVHLDTDGCVQRIQRYYDGVTWFHTCGVAGSLVSVAAARLVGRTTLTDLSDLRRDLAQNGVVARDLCLPSGAIDLGHERGLLHLTERFVRQAAAEPADAPRGRDEPAWVGRNCDIHASARFFGQVMIQDEVTIEADARIIGPTLLGSGARIGRGAGIAQCLVMPGTVVPPGASLRCRVFQGASVHLPVADAARDRQPLPPLRLTPVDEAGRRPASASASARAKRAVDFIVALLGLILLAPLFAVVAAVIRLESRGPAFFAHGREGRGGKEFRCWKFRTMVPDADALQRALYQQNAVDGPQFKLERDPRITRVGSWLRTTNIDELPQLINVLRGEMSLIGPRPSPFRENQICVPWREARLSVRPGITGLWQICRHERDAGDFHQWIHFDMLYVRHMSFWLDVKIFVGTLLTVGGRWSLPAARLIPSERLAASAMAAQAAQWVPAVVTPRG
jgi:lipopolysaccharide/colanic/teichoic acid biosynthesis glycosyltransferase